jgi:hypothetical protein
LFVTYKVCIAVQVSEEKGKYDMYPWNFSTE